jgi:hypothetical protein
VHLEAVYTSCLPKSYLLAEKYNLSHASWKSKCFDTISFGKNSNPLSMAPREERTFSYQTLTTSMDGRAPNALKGDFVSCLGELSGPPSLVSTEISSEDFEFSITSESPRDFSPTPVSISH